MIKRMTLFFGCILLIMPAGTVLAFEHSHRLFDRVLKEAVVPDGPKSRVRYGWIKEHPDNLNRYISQIEAVSASQYDGWSPDQKLAFLINAYNALTIQLILSEYPELESIKDLGGFFSGPWKLEFFTLLGEQRHLDYIEHTVIRQKFDEPRIHFALVCAAISCPALRNEAYVASHLDAQLQDAMLRFLRDPDRNALDAADETVYLSSIFKWFSEDFETGAGSVQAFVAPWITDNVALQRRIREGPFDIEYLDYNWNLNRVE